ncbi:hypothetical protein H0H92_005276 [Tricholoma furcatifolium]|nr:hypothetical protein H0H92_005276 [Tricholoma furcatifolium]
MSEMPSHSLQKRIPERDECRQDKHKSFRSDVVLETVSFECDLQKVNVRGLLSAGSKRFKHT